MKDRSRRAVPSALPGLCIRPKLEALETREVPALLLGLTATNTIARFDSATPGTLIGAPVAITSGLQTGETLLGIDFRPSTGGLYALGSTSRLYTLNLSTGAATQVGAGPFSTLLSGTSFGFDVNPVADAVRVVSDTGQNLAINATTGVVTNQTGLVYDPADPANTGFFPGAFPAATVVSAGYTQATPNTVTTLYGIDSAQDVLVQIGSPDGTPNGPGTGKVVVVGELRDAGFALVNFSAAAGLDIEANTDRAYASDGTKVYEIRITDGTVLSTATVGGSLTLTDLALAPYPTGPSTLSLAAGSFAFTADRGPVAVTVTRSGGTASAVTVDYATANGSAMAGTDYFPASGTLTFAPGETMRTIFLQVPAGTAPTGPAKTFTLSLSNPTAGSSVGTASATVTIPAVTAVPTRFFATGASQNAQVTVYNTEGGAPLFTFRAFEGTFSGEAHVAVGDVNGDGFDDIIVGAGPGAGPRIQVFDGKTLSATNQTQIASYFAFDQAFIGGVSVASGDVNGDGFADVIVGAGPGAGAHVKVFSGLGLTGGAVVELASFFAYTGFNGGVTVSSGNFNGDAFDEVITGAGAGGGPHVKVFDGRSIGGARTELASFFAFDPLFLRGITVSGGDINGDGISDVIVGAKAGAGPHVKVFDGRSLRSGIQSELASYFAFDQAFAGGINVGSRDINRDGFDDVFVGAGLGGKSNVSEFDGRSLTGGTPRLLGSFFGYDSTFTGGVFVG